MPTEILDVMDKVGSFCGLLALPYLIFQNLRSRPRFKFDFLGCFGEHIQKQGIHRYRHEVRGVLKNRSLDPNTIIKIHLVVWANRNKTSYLRHGFGHESVSETTSKQPLSLPLQFGPREARSIDVVFELPVRGTSDEKVLSEDVPAVPGSGLRRPKHDYEICFEDINGNLFDASGCQINSEEAALRWTLPNTVRELQDGHIWPFLKHYFKIILAKVKFRANVAVQALGLWR